MEYRNFGAAGIGWIFSKEKIFTKSINWINYGKLRMSYGSAGNDNIGDYQYLDKYSASSYPYQGVPGLIPNNLFNPDYGWEISRKLEVAVEMGLFKNRINFSVAYFSNRSNNQLIQYNLSLRPGLRTSNIL